MTKVQELREHAGLTQSALAEKIKVVRVTITRAEQGLLSIKTAKKLATFFGVPWTIFFDEKGTKKAQHPQPCGVERSML